MIKSFVGVRLPRSESPSMRTEQQAAPTEEHATQLPPPGNFWQRAWAHHSLSHYRRLLFLVLAVNIGLLYAGISSGRWWVDNGVNLPALANLVVANITLAILVRQQYVINFFFWIATRAPVSWPLAMRRQFGKVYHFGGLHMGGALAGTVWFALLVGAFTYHLVSGQGGVSVATLTVTYLLLALLLLMVVTALPSLRAKYHDRFELSHRFGGWGALLLFWVQTVLFANDQREALLLIQALSTTPGFWLLILITISIMLPWLRLRKVPVQIERPSDHVALAHFDYGVTPMAGSSTSISRDPLREWHAFANVPTPGKSGFRLTISRAGDWTGAFIDDMPSHVWVKGIPTAGVANIEVLFKKVIYVATGSGIGPCLPHLLAQEVPAHLIWSTRTPRTTYGDELVDEILAVQPNALIWDTSEQGRPDLVELAYSACIAHDAEAVICIANQKLTRQVVYGMESRGIPAYGAIWDS